MSLIIHKAAVGLLFVAVLALSTFSQASDFRYFRMLGGLSGAPIVPPTSAGTILE